jgi:single-strand DNA-binding protein
MANVNKVILIGNVTRDPEVKFTSKGSAVTDIGLAINRNYTLDSGEKREETTFVDVELWGRLAEIAGEYAKKGRPVYIEGRLRMDTWEDKTSGQKRSRMKVVAESLQLLGSRTDGPARPASAEESHDSPPPRSSAPARRPAPQAPAELEDDDIPF